ncbi:methylated-DNA--[protein]-cysteine S-methyltransferase [Kineococcus rhizosphaerae]|uniref:Methylated-DNA--protein-cysteine methyltransferase n=1 Tax=Kineococcus rhizosphaerae TaxID=559628 RepID=A0A2T0R130_9ACTN|nr:methylated-DNA--[protein]-cysteine S-methyltransferase [Kineococcus rhizosphaerae]PRY13000.1 methylated-DNA-[protein]-cysteine S-methyltransferase [Kineococcus rhizosphaerae]
MRWTVLGSPVGDLTVARTDAGLAGVWFADHRGGPSETLGDRDDAAFDDVREQLGEYFAGARRTFELPLAPRGDVFARRVWDALTRIPYGTTSTYGDLARDLGGVGHAQAVGVANGRNPLSIVVPCHRVVGHDGALVGYAGGLWRKRFLLDLEEPAADEAGRLF